MQWAYSFLIEHGMSGDLIATQKHNIINMSVTHVTVIIIT